MIVANHLTIWKRMCKDTWSEKDTSLNFKTRSQQRGEMTSEYKKLELSQRQMVWDLYR